ncbi:MAG: hypothetical protein WKF80_03845 [Thermomicrobiales bacterium]
MDHPQTSRVIAEDGGHPPPDTPAVEAHVLVRGDRREDLRPVGVRQAAGAAALIGRDLGPPDAARAFARMTGALWYDPLKAETYRLRGEMWATRSIVTGPVTGSLRGPLRIESGAVARWVVSDPAAGIERAISPGRLVALDRCVPGPPPADLLATVRHVADLGAEAGSAVAAREGWPWPGRLAARVRESLGAGDQGTSGTGYRGVSAGPGCP